VWVDLNEDGIPDNQIFLTAGQIVTFDVYISVPFNSLMTAGFLIDFNRCQLEVLSAQLSQLPWWSFGSRVTYDNINGIIDFVGAFYYPQSGDIPLIGFQLIAVRPGVSYLTFRYHNAPFDDFILPDGTVAYVVFPTVMVFSGFPECWGDFDGDGDVDGSDLAKFAFDYGRNDCCDSGVSSCKGDFDNDNDVDGSDLEFFAEDFGRTNCQY